MITVINKRDNQFKGEPFKVYIGRPSPLGNKYSVQRYGRDGCIEAFERDLKAALLPEHLEYNSDYLRGMRAELKRLVRLYMKHGQLVLECWCKPLACHGDVIKKYIEANLYANSAKE